MRRVVVTGIGVLSPLGQGTELTWQGILAGKSGAGRIMTFDPTDAAALIPKRRGRLSRPAARR